MASCQVKDCDNETALEAILSLSQEEPEEDSLKALHGFTIRIDTVRGLYDGIDMNRYGQTLY